MRYFFLFFVLLLLTACSSSVDVGKKECESGIFSDGKCCTYVCDKECPQGFKPNTCNCECLNESSYGLDSFSNDIDINPPEIPE